MNAEQVKEKLNKVFASRHDYAVIFSGKKSNRFNGLYKPFAKEIIIHNKNFSDDNLLLYTAFHELAHHVCDTEKGQKSAKAHTQLFWSTFHDLLDAAVKKGVYKRNISEKLGKLIEEAKSIDRKIVQLQQKLGTVLLKIEEECKENNVRFEDVVDSSVRLSRKTSKNAIRATNMELSDQHGQDVLNLLASAKEIDNRQNILNQCKAGKSIDQIKQFVKNASFNKESHVEILNKEKTRIEKTIETLSRRLRQIIDEIKLSEKPDKELIAADRISFADKRRLKYG